MTHNFRSACEDSTMKFKLSEVAAGVGGELVGGDPAEGDIEVHGLAIDSRELNPGALFAAVAGERDGHDFVGAARESGAAAALVARRVDDGPAVVVPDVQQALLRIGGMARRALPEFVVGVTGSVGKTTTKDMLSSVLTEKFKTAVSARSFNNELGVPLTLANAPIDSDAVVVEMGTRGAGHLSLLCSIAQPTISVVTAVEAVHTETMGSVEQVALAKREIVECLPPDGMAVLNADNPLVVAMADHTRADVVRFSIESPAVVPQANVRAERIRAGSDLRAEFRLTSDWGDTQVRLGARGVHNVVNALAAAAVGLAKGVSPEAVAEGLARPIDSRWRMELASTHDGLTLLNDSYNAGPASMAAALRSLASLPAARRIAVLGVMAELGDRAEAEHARVSAIAADLGVEVLAVGTDLYGRPADAESASEVAGELLGWIGAGQADTAVLVKGSRVAGLERVMVDLGASPMQ
jgi:UDP-N-acetylmuramoyl-tripeptide--D-alanyl-D-alanine ligase